MIPRTNYLNKLIGFKDKQLIKIVTGIRRCGKSTLLKMFQDYLLRAGTAPAQILSINFEEPENKELTDWESLYNYIKKALVPKKKNYIFLDEIQNVGDYERAVNGLFIRENTDLYLTGSNAWMFSGEIATLLSGRYVEIPMLPLSFKEYCSIFPQQDLRRKYRDYLINSSFPYTLELGENRDLIRDYLGGIYNTIILKDVVARKKIGDVLMLESVIRFLFDNIGNISSTKKITDTLVSMGRKISVHTVEQYLSALTDSFILYRMKRFDVKGKMHLKTGDKYYLADLGLRYFLLGSKDADQGRMLENVIFLELLRRGYELYSGKVNSAEVDFVAVKDGYPEYYQAALTVRDRETLERELSSLREIPNHNPKFLLTLDEDPPASYNGIRQINALDWLLE
ncbi:MAG: ATP-binding protein [Treponema sp.]|jgi:predicted AAA+ superfamily ATPase|nr:ATP-binding protein [Treponema sp.]